jgi:hypothetical protein
MMDAALARLVECPACGCGGADYQPGVTDTTYEGLVYHPRCLKQSRPELFCVVPCCHARIDEGPCAKHPHPPTLEQRLAKSVALTADERWKSVTAATPVIFDKEWTTLGELAGNEKMELEFNADGVLEGGMPF